MAPPIRDIPHVPLTVARAETCNTTTSAYLITLGLRLFMRNTRLYKRPVTEILTASTGNIRKIIGSGYSSL